MPHDFRRERELSGILRSIPMAAQVSVDSAALLNRKADFARSIGSASGMEMAPLHGRWMNETPIPLRLLGLALALLLPACEAELLADGALDRSLDTEELPLPGEQLPGEELPGEELPGEQIPDDGQPSDLCTDGALLCGGLCTPATENDEHCGACGNACPSGSSCQSSICVCPSGVVCGGQCIGQDDFFNCGACGLTCDTSEVCSAGACSCSPGLEHCESGCTTLDSDAGNCGSCGNACPSHLVCSGGECVSGCAEGEEQCGQSCVNIQGNDPAHCGACESVCSGGRTCEGGSCDCPSGGAWCSESCVDTQTNQSHCGSCGTNCGSERSCVTGSCQCTGGRTWNGSACTCSGGRSWNGTSCVCTAPLSWNGTTCACSGSLSQCGGSCVNTQTDGNNCGTCGTVCTGGRTCSSSSCQCSGGRTWSGSACECSGGRTWNGTACVCSGGRNWSGSACECPSGQTWNGSACTSSTAVFDQCRFHFGTIDSYAKNSSTIRAQIDFFTPGWMGYQSTFDQTYVCNDVNGTLSGKVPVVVSYVAAFYSKRLGRCDCNVDSCGANNNLCVHGANDIKQGINQILDIYRSYAQGYANCFGTTKPIIFEMEPDWYQYTNSSQTSPMTNAQAANYMSQFVNVIKQYLPNARFSMDISPWVAPNNGSDHGQSWYGNFDMSLFSFINTSGGSTEAANTRIRQANNMTWAGVSQVTGKPILADTGYGANGVSAGHDSNWDNPTYINARMNDGVVSISQYNPNSNWGSTISSIRTQLNTPRYCP